MLGRHFILTLVYFLLPVQLFPVPEKAMKTSQAPDLPSVSNIRLFLSGDVMTGRGIDQVLPHAVDPRLYESYVKDANEYVKLAERKKGPIPEKVSYSYSWGDALDIWNQVDPDLKIINLETSITDNGSPWPGKGIHYRMHPANVPAFTVAGIDFCSLANNHTLDWGSSGLEETLRSLKNAGIAQAGAGANLEEALEPAILETGKGRVLIFAYGAKSSGIPESWAATAGRSGINLLPDLSEETVNLIGEQVKRVKKPGDVVILSIHWGSNWGYQVPPEQRRFAHQLIKQAAVDVIHGHSSHHPRPIEVYNDKLILYGAGDFINDYEGIGGNEPFRDDLSLMYFPEIDPASGKLTSMKMVPMHIQNFRLRKASSADAKWLQNTLDSISSKFGTAVSLKEDNTLSLQW